MVHDYDMKLRLHAFRKARPVIWLAAVAASAVWLEWCVVAAPLRVATFRCDVTPWPGETLVWTAKLVKVEEPLLAKGIVLEDGTNRYVLCALDWCLLARSEERRVGKEGRSRWWPY